ncbi:MAG: GAF domain-containing protein [Ignavibacteriales bacterium]|nr:GAF domain-containing protein [Ignavibacteriales bacterium]
MATSPTRSRARNMAFKLKIGEGLAGWVVANRESVLVGDLLKDPRWVATAASSREHRSAIVVPLLVADDVIGVLMVFHRKVNLLQRRTSEHGQGHCRAGRGCDQ